MANTLNQVNIETGNIVEAYHVTQSIDAFTGVVAYDISLSGSFNMTGSINGEPGFLFTNDKDAGTNPCAEINLKANQFCNFLTIIKICFWLYRADPTLHKNS